MTKPVMSIFCSLSFLILGGYGQLWADSFPETTGNLNIALTQDTGYPGEWPWGIYQFDKQNIYVSKMDGDGNMLAADVVLGMVGTSMVMDQQVNAAKKGIGDHEAELAFNLLASTKESLIRQLPAFDKAHRFTVIDDTDHSQVRITPYLIYSFMNEEKARMWVYLKAQLFQNGAKTWEGHYFSALGEPRPIEGPHSWTANRDQDLNTYFAYNLQNVVWALYADMFGTFHYGNGPYEDLNGRWIFHLKPVLVKSQVLLNNSNRKVVYVDGNYCKGVNVLEPSFNEKESPDH